LHIAEQSGQQVDAAAWRYLLAVTWRQICAAGRHSRAHGESHLVLVFLTRLWLYSSVKSGLSICSLQVSTLLSRVGDELVLALLLHGAVFALLPGGNYVQLAGTPLHTVRS
jgi:hypothetical protein